MEAIIARTVQVLIALAGAYLLALWFVLVIWTYRDIESRSRSVITQVFSTLLAVLFFVPGVLLYLILRPKETVDAAFQRSLEEEYLLQDLEELPLCHSCQRYIEDDFILCPHCHTKLREPCTACGRLVHLRWSLCPYCGAEQSEQAAIARERVEEPAARWSATARRRRTAPVVAPRPTPALARAAMPPQPATELLPATQEEPVTASLKVLRNGAANVPIRLFDRKKTRAAARRNGTERAPVTEDGQSATANGNGVSFWRANGHDGEAAGGSSLANAAESWIARIRGQASKDIPRSPEEHESPQQPDLERVPAHLVRERD